MIIIKVELHSGRDGSIRELGRMVIANDGSGSKEVGNYWGTLHTEYGVRGFRRTNFRRLDCSVWTLIGSILSKLGHVKGVKEVEEVKSRDDIAFLKNYLNNGQK